MKKNIIWSEQRRAAACSNGRPSMLRRLAAMLVMIVSAAMQTWATDVTFTLGDKLTDTKDGVTFAFADGCTIYQNDTYLNHVKMPKDKGTLTISVESGKTIDNIKLQVLKGTTTSALAEVPSVSFDSNASKITYDTDGGLNATWTDKTKVVLKSDGNKEGRFYSITVSYTDNGSAEIHDVTIADIETPSIQPSTGTYAVLPKVTFTNPGGDVPEGLTQEGYYTLNGTDPTVSETAVKYDGNAFTPVLPEGTDNITVRYAIKRFQTNKPTNVKWSSYAEAVYTIKAEEKEVTNEVIALNTKDATTTGDDAKGYTLTKSSDNITIKYVGMSKPGSGSVNFITDDKLTITSSENIRKIELNYNRNYVANNFAVSPESSGTSVYTKNLLTWTANEDASVKEITFTDNHGTGNKVQLSSVTVYYDGYNLPVAPALDPTPDKGDVYLAIPEITLTPADNSTLSGDFTTVYTIDGSDPTENANATTATGVTKWTPSVTLTTQTQTYTVKAATKRVVGGNTLWSDIITREFTYGIASPTIDPTEEKFVNTNASQTITIDHPQKDKGVNVYVAKYTGNEKQDPVYNKVELPYTFDLNKQTTTVKMYAEYNGVKTEEETNVYIYLDASEAYIFKSEEDKTSGTEVEKNGVTMTFGGMYLGKDKDGKEIGGFKTLSKGKIPELGYTRFVRSETIIQGANDAASETKVEYVHPQTNAAQHDNTFALPAQGSFFKFEPEYNGSLTVFVEQQGAIDKGNDTFTPEYVKKRPVYFVDETGKSIAADYAYTTSRINKSDWEKTMSTESKPFSKFNYTKEYIENLKKYYNDIILGNNKDYKNMNAAIDADKQHEAVTLGTDFQPVIALHTDDSAAKGILKNDGVYGADGDQNIDQTGYMLINEGYVTYRFPVKAGKTYFLFGWRTKLGICGFRFQKDEAATAADVTLDGSADNTATIQGLTVGAQYNVTVKNRTFKKDKWYALVLPFSVSQQQMKQVFGKDVMTVHFDGVDGTDLDLFEHFYKMTVGGTPLLVKPSQDVAGDILFKNVTLTSKEVQPIVKNGFKADGSWQNVDFPDYSYFIDARDNTFYQYNPDKAVAGTAKPHAGALRAWVIADGDAAQAKQLTMRINGIGDSQETDGIRSALFGEADADEAASLTGIYTISGQKLAATSTKGLAKGMYIVNGKKLIVK